MKRLVVIVVLSLISVPFFGAAPAWAGRDIVVQLDDDYYHDRRHGHDYEDDYDDRPQERYRDRDRNQRIGYLLGRIAGQKISGKKRERVNIVYDDIYEDDNIVVRKAIDARTGKRVVIVQHRR